MRLTTSVWGARRSDLLRRLGPVVLVALMTGLVGWTWALVLPFGWGDDELQHLDTVLYLRQNLALPILTENPEAFFRYPDRAAWTYLALPTCHPPSQRAC